MKKNLLLIILINLSIAASVYGGKVNWTAQPFNSDAFVVNKGQFDGKNDLPGTQILYGGKDHGMNYYFTSTGMTFAYEHTTYFKKEAKEHGKIIESSIDKNEKFEIKKLAYHIEWVNSNQNVQLIAESKVGERFNYMAEVDPVQNSWYHVPGYKKLVYKELYPNIDLEYTYHEQNGIKYKFVLHPGADPSVIQLKYSESCDLSLDNQGNLHIPTLDGDMIDHAPNTYYQSNNAALNSSFNLQGQLVTFNIANYDNSQAVEIDPWTSVPTGLTGSQIAYDVARDYDGNCYVHGGSAPFSIQKFNPNGAAVWSFTSTYSTYLGDMECDTSGNVYFSHGFNSGSRVKVDSTGVVQWSQTGGFAEFWSLSFNCDYSQLVAAGHTGPCMTCMDLIAEIDPNTGAFINTTSMYMNEIRTITTGPSGDIFGITNGLVVQGNGPNRILRATSNFTGVYEIISGYTINEMGTSYSTGGCCMGFDGVMADNCYLYTTDGQTLDKRDKATAAVVQTVTIPTGIFDANAGISIDSCGNIYVGSQDSVYKYSNTLNLLETAYTQGPIYDVTVNVGGEVVACGPGFITSVDLTSCPPTSCAIIGGGLFSITNGTDATCNNSDGSATANAIGGYTPYSYIWSNGQTDQTATGLSAGTYYVTITDSIGCMSAIDTVLIAEGVGTDMDSIIVSETCNLCNGTATVLITGGTPPFDYLWDVNAGSQTDSLATGLCPGTYSVTITDEDSCTSVFTVIVDAIPLPTVNIGPDTLLCENEQITLDGGQWSGYLWSNGETTQTILVYLPNQYILEITDTNGCTATDTINIAYSIIHVDLPPQVVICPGETVTLDAGNDAVNYLWSTNETTQTITVSNAGQYWVLLDDGGRCQNGDTVTVIIASLPDIDIQIDPGICATRILTAIADAGATFEWSTGETTASIVVTKADEYWVMINDGNCDNYDTVDVSIEYIEPEIIIPNVFTPNGDGQNEELVFQLGELKQYNIKVYNRWGRKIFESTDSSNTWDGKIDGKPGKDGIYYYVLVYESLCDGLGEITVNGYVTVLR